MGVVDWAQINLGVGTTTAVLYTEVTYLVTHSEYEVYIALIKVDGTAEELLMYRRSD